MDDKQMEQKAYAETLEGSMRALGQTIRETFWIDKLESWLRKVTK